MNAVLCLSALLAVIGSSAGLQCSTSKYDGIPTAWKSMQNSCLEKMKEQVSHEISASMEYLAMAAYFSRDTVNRPGFAKIFFESAAEERQHAMKILEYLLMRGELLSDLTGRINIQPITKHEWADGVEALEKTLILETKVTNYILDIIKACESDKKFNDYHLVDYLTGDFLEEQYTGQKVIADRISTLGKMRSAYGDIGEFLFDKKLLASE